MAEEKNPFREPTEEEAKRLPEFKEKWTDIGLATGPTSQAEAEEAVREAYTCAKLTPPPEVIVLPNPLEGAVAADIVRRAEDLPAALKWIRDNKGDDDAFRKRGIAADATPFDGAAYGSLEAAWLGFYDFYEEVVKVEGLDVLKGLQLASKAFGIWWPFDEVALVSARPTELHLQEGVPHKDGGPAIVYEGGFKVFCLRGVLVTQQIAETPGHELDPQLMIKEGNAEIRRIIAEKIGPERLLRKLNSEVLEKASFTFLVPVAYEAEKNAPPGQRSVRYEEKELDYELILLDMGDNRRRPWLRMTDPSTGVEYVEGAHPDTKSIKQEILRRNNGKWPTVLA